LQVRERPAQLGEAFRFVGPSGCDRLGLNKDAVHATSQCETNKREEHDTRQPSRCVAPQRPPF
jgi:hypothetical protein